MFDIVYEKNVFSTPFLSGYKELKIPIIDKNETPVWPEMFPIEKVRKIRETVGNRHFSAQMLLEYVPSDKIRLDPGGIKFYDSDFDIRSCKIDENVITGIAIYWDPSTGRKTADSSVCVLVYRDDKNRRVFIHDILYMIVPDEIEYPLSYQCNLALDFVRRHHGRSISVETNGIGGALPEIMRAGLNHEQNGIQVRPVNNSRHKQDRILDAIEPLLSTGRLYAHRRITQTPIISEMLGWNPAGGAEHDDGLDAIAGAIAIQPIALHPIGRGLYTANTKFNV